MITSTNTANMVMDYLKEQIVKGVYKPGEKINIDELAKVLEISKIPIREALMQLQPMGLVTYTANIGMRVARLGDEDAKEILEILFRLTQKEAPKKEIKAGDALEIYEDLIEETKPYKNKQLKEAVQLYCNQLLLWKEENDDIEEKAISE